MDETTEPKTLLSLDTLVVRNRIVIDGVSYEVNRPEDLGAVPGAKMRQNAALILKMQRENFGDDVEEVAAVCDALDVAVRAILRGCPEEVHDRLSDNMRLQIVQRFLIAAGLLKEEDPAAGPLAAPPIGAKSSRASRGSTASHRRAG